MKLEEKSLGEGTGGDAGRVEGLDQGQGLADLGRRGMAGDADLRKVGAEKTVLVQVADNLGGSGTDDRIDLREGELGREVIGQGFRQDFGFEEGLAGIEAGAIGTGGCDGPIGIAGGKVGLVLILGGGFRRVDRTELLFQDGIGLKFRLKEVLKFQRGGLQKLEGLLDLGRDRNGLPQAGLKGQGHGGIFRLGFP